MAMTSRLLQIIGLFCKRALQKRRYSAKEPLVPYMCTVQGALYVLELFKKLLQIIGLFCKRALQKRRNKVLHTYDVKLEYEVLRERHSFSKNECAC